MSKWCYNYDSGGYEDIDEIGHEESIHTIGMIANIKESAKKKKEENERKRKKNVAGKKRKKKSIVGKKRKMTGK